MTDLSVSGLVYVDANPIAYAFEGPEDLASVLLKLFAIFRSKPSLAVTSELTLAEVLPKKRTPDRHFLDLLVWSKVFDLKPVTREILIETARYRRASGTPMADGRIAMPKLPDAIHVVTASQSKCQYFLSADGRLKLPPTMRHVKATAPGVIALIEELS